MSFTLVSRYLALFAVVAIAVFRPQIGEAFFGGIERLTRGAARHRTAAWISSGVLVLAVRIVLLPVWPVPKPVIYDEFGYILGADTFARGRLTNPTHKLAEFFESPYVLQQPTYASKYPPAQSLAMAAGDVVFGDPWFGVWLSCGIMMSALVWALQGWLPASWALLGGVLTMPLAIHSYWMNSYWGGAVAGTGGALLLGGYARVVKQNQVWYAIAMGAGLAVLGNSRPYEGLVFSMPVVIGLLLSRSRWKALALIAAVLIPALAATGWYNRAVTGSVLQLPFTEYARQYARIPLFNFQPLQPEKTYGTHYGTAVMSDLHENWEVEQWRKARTWQLLSLRFEDWKSVATTLLGSSLMGLLILVFASNLWRDKGIRLPLVCVLAAVAGSLIEICYYQHYAGPVTVALLIVAVQAIRHLRQWNPGGLLAGRFLSRAVPILVVAAAVGSQARVIFRHEPAENSQPKNARRDQVAAGLLGDQVSQHVILVRYTGHQSPHEEWVYNGADVDGQDVIWAHDLGASRNAALVEYYKDRKIWLLQPDINTTRLEPYR